MGRGYLDGVNKPLPEPKDINVLKLPVEEGKRTALLCNRFSPKLFSIADKIILLLSKGRGPSSVSAVLLLGVPEQNQ